MYPVIAAIATAIIMIIIAVVLSRVFSIRLMAATILCSIAFIYVGFSLKGNPLESILLEVFVAMGFYFLALRGYIKNMALLGYGIIAHGIWDMLHHGSWLIKTDIPAYWPLYCSVVDFIYGAYIVVVSKRSTSVA
jgi:hypothetical protein